MPAAPKFDLNQIAGEPTKHVEVSINVKPPESEAEQTHRLSADLARDRHARLKDTIILISVILGVGAILFVCVRLTLDHQTSPEDTKGATAVLASTVALGVGYLLGKERSSS